MKFVYVNQGVGRFTRLGIPFPHFTAAFIGCLEIVGGLLLLTGLMTRLIAIPFIGEMIEAILSTKISLYLGTSPLPLPPALPQVGFWAVLHEIRSDYAQILTVIFLLINGPGKWSLDAVLLRKWRTGRRFGTRPLGPVAGFVGCRSPLKSLTALEILARREDEPPRRYTVGAVADRTGDFGSFEELAMPHFAKLYNFAHWLTQDRAAAEDLVQETYMKALRGFPPSSRERTSAPGCTRSCGIPS